MDRNLYDTINAKDYGYLYGFSLFETFFVNSIGNVFLLDKHIERLFSSLKHFRFEIDSDEQQFISLIKDYISINGICSKILRVTVSFGNRKENIPSAINIILRDNTYSINKCININQGFNLLVSNQRKNISSPIVQHKTSNYLENLIAADEAVIKGFNDALILNTENNVAETSKANIFWVSGGILYTPDTQSGILPGIIRQWVIDTAHSLGLECLEGKYCYDLLDHSDESFITNSVMGMIPVNHIDNSGTIKIFSDNTVYSSLYNIFIKEAEYTDCRIFSG